MVQGQISHENGMLVFWSIGSSSDRQKITDGFRAAGAEAFIPDERSQFACLKAALEELYPQALVRPLLKREGLALVNEEKGEDRNEYHHEGTFKIEEAEAGRYEYRLQEAYRKAQGTLHPVNVSNALVEIVESLAGVSLRPSGGFYWLAPQHREFWAKIAAVIEDAGKSQVFTLTIRADIEAARAIVAGLTREAAQEALEIERLIATNDLGNRALNTQATRAEKMCDKLAAYEGVLDVSLADVRAKMETAREAALRAQLVAAGN